METSEEAAANIQAMGLAWARMATAEVGRGSGILGAFGGRVGRVS